MDTPTADVILHATFAPDGTCVSIAEQPEWAGPHQWFQHLCRNTANAFRPLQGGRGVFVMARTVLDGLKRQP